LTYLPSYFSILTEKTVERQAIYIWKLWGTNLLTQYSAMQFFSTL